MVVGMGEDPSIGEYERLLMSMKTTARKELILLHPDRSVIPGSTREWLKVSIFVRTSLPDLTRFVQVRPWIHQHIHVELPVRRLRLFAFRPQLTDVSTGPQNARA